MTSYKNESSPTPEQRVERASGDFKKNILVKNKDNRGVRLYDQRLVDYLRPTEKLEYVLWMHFRKCKIINPDGDKEKLAKSRDGYEYLVLTDERLFFLVGNESGDEMTEFAYHQLSDAEDDYGILVFSDEDGFTYRFKHDKHYTDITPAANYIRSQIRKKSNKKHDLDDTIESVSEELENIEKDINEGKLENIETLLTEIDSQINSARTSATEHNFEENINKVDELEQYLDELQSDLLQEQRNQLSNLVDSIYSKLDEVESQIIKEEPKKAKETLRNIKSDTQTISTTAIKYDCEMLNDDLDFFNDEIQSLDEEIQNAKYIISKKSNIDEKLELIEEETNNANFERAEAASVVAENQLNNVKNTINRCDVKYFDDKITQLEERYQQLSERLSHEKATVNKLSDSIYSDVSIDYNSIIDEQHVGSGGNADVSKATVAIDDTEITVAIKKPRMTDTVNFAAADRLLKEAETWSKLDDHNHIINVIDYGSRPVPWIAMEYMDAGHLGERSGDLNIKQAVWTAIAMTKAVRHAHRRGIAHLDLKPENVLFRSMEDTWDLPKVADWGLSKQLLEHSKSIEGLSPQYSAPEQFDDSYGHTDDLTDVYQLGAVFYELFTGQPPFNGQPARVMNQVLNEEPQLPSTVADVPTELDEVLSTALSKEKADRYEDVLLLRNDLQEIFDSL